jgi:hypothetical protein
VHAREDAVERPWEHTFLGFTVTRHGTRLEVLRPLRHASALRSGCGTERWCASHTWPRDPGSPRVIRMTKSEIRAIHAWQANENLVCQRAGRRENDFAISIKSAEDPKGSGQVGCKEHVIMALPTRSDTCNILKLHGKRSRGQWANVDGGRYRRARRHGAGSVHARQVLEARTGPPPRAAPLRTRLSESRGHCDAAACV